MALRPLLLLALVVAGAACSRADGTDGATAPAHGEGHRRMLGVLRDLHALRHEENVFVGDRAVRLARAAIDGAGGGGPWQAHQELGYALVRLGREREGLKVLQDALQAVASGELAGGADAELSLHFHLGVAWLRLGETENCCQQRNEQSCILPLRGGALHGKPEGSERAMAHFLWVLARTPEDDYWHLANRWLLNVAAMTLGRHPEAVPERHRIPERALRSAAGFPHLANAGARLGLDQEGLSGGIAVEDFDGDGRLDVLASDWATDGQLRLFVRAADGAFVDHTTAAGLDGLYGGLNLVTGDYDGDGDVDALVLRGAWLLEFGRHPNSLLRNDGAGRFEDVTFASGLGRQHWPTQTAAFCDYDRDGDLDLCIGNECSSKLRCANQLFRNDGDGTFTDVAEAAGVENFAYCKAVAWGDVDGDLWPDLYVSNIDGPNRLYRNRGDGTFEDMAAARGVQDPVASFPCWFWDFDQDGHLDLWVGAYATGIGHLAAWHLGIDVPQETDRLYRGDGQGGFVDVTASRGLAAPTMPMGCNFGDLDGDGYPDVYLGTGDTHLYSLMPNVLWKNERGERFVDVTMASGTGHLQKGHGIAFADFDHDGDLDLFARLGGAYRGDAYASTVFENPGFGNRWLALRLEGRHSERSALHARIRVVVADAGGERTVHARVGTGGSFGCNPLRQTIGLGRAERLVRVEVSWPRDGRSQTWTGLDLDRGYRLVEGEADAAALDLRPCAPPPR
ncbi:MAG: CRTAC1 family protein [Planctomycetota bacterium]